MHQQEVEPEADYADSDSEWRDFEFLHDRDDHEDDVDRQEQDDAKE